jgi:hypothetical protein
MTPRALPAAVTAALLLAVAACSSPTVKPPAVIVTPSPTPSTATLLQYASGLNASIKGFEEAWNSYDTDCAIGAATAFGCYAEVGTMYYAAMTIDQVFTNLSDPSLSTYVGPPPTALASLVATTHTDIQPVTKDSVDGNHPGVLLMVEANALDQDCLSWDPYLAA